MADYTYPYERAAMRGDEMPDSLDIVDQLNFLCLRSLYAQNRAGIIDRTVGSAEKAKLRRQRDFWEQRLFFREKLAKHCVEMFQAVEAAANAYAKDRTLENADRLYRAVYGVGVRRINDNCDGLQKADGKV